MKSKMIFLVLFASTIFSATIFAQSKKELKSEIEQLKQQNQMMLQMMQMQQQNHQMQQWNNNQIPQQPINNQQTHHDQTIASPDGQAIQKTRIQMLTEDTAGQDIRGYGKDMSAKSNFARNKAENMARMELARQIEAYARYAISQYNEETMAGGERGLNSNEQESAITAAKQVIEGARILASQEYYNPVNSMYTWEVCVVYDRAGLYSVMAEQNARILKNKIQFEQDMQKYFDEMDRMQGRLTTQEKAQAVQNQVQQEQLNAQQQRDMQMQQQQFNNNQQAIQQQQQYNLQYQQQQNQYNLQQQSLQNQQQQNQHEQQNSSVNEQKDFL